MMAKLFLLLLAFPILAWGATNRNVKQSPGAGEFDNILDAYNTAVSGDSIVLFGDVTYSGAKNSGLTIGSSSKNTITIKANTGDHPKIDMAGSNRGFSIAASHITIDGIEMYGWEAGLTTNAAIYCANGSVTDLIIKNCKLHAGDNDPAVGIGHCAEQPNGSHPCIANNPQTSAEKVAYAGESMGNSNDGYCIYVKDAKHITIMNNEAWGTEDFCQMVNVWAENATNSLGDNGDYDHGTLISGNKIHDIPEWGFGASTGTNWVRFENNTVADLGGYNMSSSKVNPNPTGAYHTDGMHMFGSATICANPPCGPGNPAQCDPSGPSFAHFLVRNNIFRNTGSYGPFFEYNCYPSVDIVIANNLIYNTKGSTGTVHGFTDYGTSFTSVGIAAGANPDPKAGGKGARFYNNTVINWSIGLNANPKASGAGPVDFENNIVMRCGTGISVGETASAIDYNFYGKAGTPDGNNRDSSGGGDLKYLGSTYVNAQTANNKPAGIEAHGINDVPGITDPTTTFNWVGAPFTADTAKPIGKANVLNSVTFDGLPFLTDILGNTRGTQWDMGAYEWAGAPPPSINGPGTATFKPAGTDDCNAGTNCVSYTTSNFSNGVPTLTNSVTSGPNGPGNMPANVTFSSTAGSGTATIHGTASGATVGTYSMTITASGSGGQSDIQTLGLTIASNAAPTVSITKPSNNATFTSGATIPLEATAGDTDGQVVSVGYYDGNTLIGNSSGPSPWAISWSGATVGTHTLTAKATDDGGAVTTSSSIAITINAAAAPTPATIRVRP